MCLFITYLFSLGLRRTEYQTTRPLLFSLQQATQLRKMREEKAEHHEEEIDNHKDSIRDLEDEIKRHKDKIRRHKRKLDDADEETDSD